MVSYYYKSKNAESMEEATTFRSRHFNMIVKRKKHAVYDIMKLGKSGLLMFISYVHISISVSISFPLYHF